MTKKTKSKRKLNLKRPNVNFRKPSIKLGRNVFSHILTVLSFIPIVAMLPIAAPTFNLEINDYEFKSEPIQINSETTGESKKLIFAESKDFQGGVSFKLGVQTLEAGPAKEGESENQEPQPLDKSTIDKTINVLRSRIASIGNIDSKIYKFENGKDVQILVEMSSSREVIKSLPLYLSLEGKNIEIWTDNPEYVAPTDGSQASTISKLMASGLDKDDIAAAIPVDGTDRTLGVPGYKIVFKKDSLEEVQQIMSSMKSYDGFSLVIDGEVYGQISPSTPQFGQNQGLTIDSFAEVYFVNVDLTSDKDVYSLRAITSVINTQSLPSQVDVLTATNNTSPSIIANMDQMKVAFVGGFIILAIVSLFVLREYGLIPLILTGEILIISVGILKMFEQKLNLNLIFGVLIGASLAYISYFLFTSIVKRADNLPESLKSHRKTFSSMIFWLSVLLIFWVAVFEYLNLNFTYQLNSGLGVSLIALIISNAITFPTLFNEFFLLGKKNDK